MAADGFERRQEQLAAVDVDPLDDPFERGLGVDQVAVLLREAAEAGFEIVELVERIEIHRAELVELVAELGDFVFDCVAVTLDVRPAPRSLKRARRLRRLRSMP